MMMMTRGSNSLEVIHKSEFEVSEQSIFVGIILILVNGHPRGGCVRIFSRDLSIFFNSKLRKIPRLSDLWITSTGSIYVCRKSTALETLSFCVIFGLFSAYFFALPLFDMANQSCREGEGMLTWRTRVSIPGAKKSRILTTAYGPEPGIGLTLSLIHI